MARIKIKDLPKDAKISKEELKRIKGGTFGAYLQLDGRSQTWMPPEPLGYGKIEIGETTVGWDPGDSIR